MFASHLNIDSLSETISIVQEAVTFYARNNHHHAIVMIPRKWLKEIKETCSGEGYNVVEPTRNDGCDKVVITIYW